MHENRPHTSVREIHPLRGKTKSYAEILPFYAQKLTVYAEISPSYAEIRIIIIKQRPKSTSQ